MTVFAFHPLYYLVVNFGTKVPSPGKTGLWVKQLENYSDGQSCSGVIIARYSERVEALVMVRVPLLSVLLGA